MSADVAPPSRRRNPVRPQQRGELRRTRLLAALSDELKNQSLAEVSVADVADKAGLGRSAFYFYFSSKNEAVTHLLSDIFDEQVAEVGAIVGGDGDLQGNLSRALGSVVESWCSQRRLFLAMLDARDADVETRSIWDAWLRRYEVFVAAYIDRHVDCGAVDSVELAHSLLSLNERVLERYLRAGTDSAGAARVHAALVHIWTAAIFGRQR